MGVFSHQLNFCGAESLQLWQDLNESRKRMSTSQIVTLVESCYEGHYKTKNNNINSPSSIM